jgi:hypothetical protein
MRKLAHKILATLVFAGAVGAASGEPFSAANALGPLAPDAIFVQTGRAPDTSTLSLGLQWDWSKAWLVGERARVSGYNEMSVGHWRADEGGGSAIVTQVGFTPTFRYWPTGATTGWFFEGAVGLNVLTPIYRTKEKRFSTAFNFGDHVAVGYRQHNARGLEWSLRLQHFSNAGIDQPNPGENFVQLRLVVPLGQRSAHSLH